MKERLAAGLRASAGPLLILFVAFFAITPELARGCSCGHDFDFHLVLWFDALGSWRQGTFYPHWTPSPNYEAGEPRFIFYPPMTWMLGAGLGAVLDWNWVSVALTWLMLAGAGLATYALARQVLPRGTSTLAGCVALYSGYSLFNAYERTAFGELTGGIWIPLLLLFALREHRPEETLLRRAFDGSTVPLALVLAGAWLSDVPLGVIACYLLAAVALTHAALRRSWAPVLRATMATVLGIGLASVYLLPAIVQQKWVDVHEATSDPGSRIEDSWLFARHHNPAFDQHDLELFRVSVIGITVIAAALLCLSIARKRRMLPESRAFWLPLALIPVVVLLLQLPISLPVWSVVPKMRFLQFPWRWLVTVQAPLGIFAACALRFERRWVRALSTLGLGFGASAITVSAGVNLFQACYPEDAPWSMIDNYTGHIGFEGADEYAPPFADNSLLALNLPAACLASSATTALGRGPAGTTPQWSTGQESCLATFPIASTARPAAEHLRIAFNAPRAGFLIVRLRSYPAWRIALNGTTLTQLPEREDGLIAVPVAAGQGDLRIDWALSASDMAARWLSALALALLVALFAVERKFARAHLS